MPGKSDADQSATAMHQQRQQALRELAQGQPGRDTPSAEPGRLALDAHEPHRSRRNMLIAGIAGVLLIGVVVAVLVRSHAGQSHATAHHILLPQMIPAATGLSCAQDIAWSPDGSRIAIVGYQRTCPQDGYGSFAYEAGQVDIFDAATHKLLAQVQPDPTVDAALHLPAPAWATPSPSQPRGDTAAQVVNYSNLQWSPDGKSLAVSFTIQSIDGPAVNGVWPYHVIVGLYLVGADGSNAHVLAHTLTPNECAFGAEWNVQSGTLASIPPATAPGCASRQWAYSPPSPAITYTWGEQGKLSGTPALTASATPATPPVGPVGNPEGGSSFSIWQPGLVSGQSTDAMRQAKLPPIPTFSTSFLAWSPNGQYVLDVMAQDWRLTSAQAPVPSAASLQATGLAGAPILPARDAEVADLSSQTPAHVHNAFGVSRSEAGAALAWSPSGWYVALVERIGPASNVVNPDQLRVVVFDAATENLLVTLQPEVAANPNYRDSVGGYTSLRWSADGSHLLLFDGNLGAISVFGPEQLPKA